MKLWDRDNINQSIVRKRIKIWRHTYTFFKESYDRTIVRATKITKHFLTIVLEQPNLIGLSLYSPVYLHTEPHQNVVTLKTEDRDGRKNKETIPVSKSNQRVHRKSSAYVKGGVLSLRLFL